MIKYEEQIDIVLAGYSPERIERLLVGLENMMDRVFEVSEVGIGGLCVLNARANKHTYIKQYYRCKDFLTTISKNEVYATYWWEKYSVQPRTKWLNAVINKIKNNEIYNRTD
jgi:hypothetical protein